MGASKKYNIIIVVLLLLWVLTRFNDEVAKSYVTN